MAPAGSSGLASRAPSPAYHPPSSAPSSPAAGRKRPRQSTSGTGRAGEAVGAVRAPPGLRGRACGAFATAPAPYSSHDFSRPHPDFEDEPVTKSLWVHNTYPPATSTQDWVAVDFAARSVRSRICNPNCDSQSLFVQAGAKLPISSGLGALPLYGPPQAYASQPEAPSPVQSNNTSTKPIPTHDSSPLPPAPPVLLPAGAPAAGAVVPAAAFPAVLSEPCAWFDLPLAGAEHDMDETGPPGPLAPTAPYFQSAEFSAASWALPFASRALAEPLASAESNAVVFRVGRLGRVFRHMLVPQLHCGPDGH
jgi:hypothetical protein